MSPGGARHARVRVLVASLAACARCQACRGTAGKRGQAQGPLGRRREVRGSTRHGGGIAIEESEQLAQAQKGLLLKGRPRPRVAIPRG